MPKPSEMMAKIKNVFNDDEKAAAPASSIPDFNEVNDMLEAADHEPIDEDEYAALLEWAAQHERVLNAESFID